jgi:hypothetical protein
MLIEKGQIFTPEKKGLLIKEVENELARLDEALRKKSLGSSALALVRENRTKLQTLLTLLFEKKGVVTPQETDDILQTLGDAKRSRLETQYYMGVKKSTIYLGVVLGLGIGIYYYIKKRNK